MKLSKEDRTKLEQMRRQTRDKKQHIRLSVLIMLDEGFTHEVIAVSLGIDPDTVGNYKNKYIHKGLDEYLKDNYLAYITLYEKLLENNPGKKLILICDNAPYYRSQLLQDWLRAKPLIQQWFLPTYSPNLNIIERLWRFMKKQAIGLSFHPTYQSFKAAILHFFEHLDDYEYELKKLLTLKFQILQSPLRKTS